MDFQAAFNIAIALVGALGGWMLKSISDAIRDLRDRDNALTTELHQIHILVAGDYIKREEFKDELNAIFDMLRQIDAKLHGKADKQ